MVQFLKVREALFSTVDSPVRHLRDMHVYSKDLPLHLIRIERLPETG